MNLVNKGGEWFNDIYIFFTMIPNFEIKGSTIVKYYPLHSIILICQIFNTGYLFNNKKYRGLAVTEKQQP